MSYFLSNLSIFLRVLGGQCDHRMWPSTILPVLFSLLVPESVLGRGRCAEATWHVPGTNAFVILVATADCGVICGTMTLAERWSIGFHSGLVLCGSHVQASTDPTPSSGYNPAPASLLSPHPEHPGQASWFFSLISWG